MPENQISQRDLLFANNVITIGTAANLVGVIVREIAGNDISTTIDGEKATPSFLYNLAISKFKQNLETKKVRTF